MLQQVKVTVIIIFGLCVFQCKPATETHQELPKENENIKQYQHLTGKVIGTYYSIKYKGDQNFNASLDSLYEALNNSLSTYVEEATISKFNSSSASITFNSKEDIHFVEVWERAKDIYTSSQGDFDPTVGPLVNYWGFGYKNKQIREKSSLKEIEQLLKVVGFDKISISRDRDNIHLEKLNAAAELDFSAIAKGYYVDQVGELLERNGVSNYLVDIGGESKALGINHLNQVWAVGVNKPKEDSKYSELELAIKLDNKSVASSGNYRNFYINEAGEKYVHTIDPKTGLTKASSLLSATIIADDCMSADAYATTCMVKGLHGAKEYIESIENVEACFIVADKNGTLIIKYTSGFGQFILPI